MASVNRTVYGYSMHAHDGEDVIDYADFFSYLGSRSLAELQTNLGQEIVAITSIRVNDGIKFSLRFVRGVEGVPPLYYDPATGAEAYGDLGDRILVNSSWAFIDVSTRLAAFERRRPGVGANQIGMALSLIGRELGYGSRITFSFNPVTDRTFLEELDTYERIKVAEIELNRPNLDWTDDASKLTDYAEESNAQRVAVRVIADRGDSLDPSDGVVGDIKAFVRNRIAPLANLRITGRKTGEKADSSMSLTRHQAKQKASFSSDVSQEVENDALETAGNALLEEMAGSIGDHDGKQ